MRRVLSLIIALIVLTLVVLLIRTTTFPSRQKEVPPVTQVAVSSSAVQHLAEALRYRTISPAVSAEIDSAAFRAYLAFLERTYPLTDGTLEKRCFNDFSLLYKWQGTDTDLKPMLLLSHYDVVPVETATRDEWTHAPFSGEYTGEMVWGRGAIDDKMAGIAILEALEMLIAEGYQPQRTVFFSLGHDEEKGGPHGAAAIAEYLREQGIELSYVLDEGGAITKDIIPEVYKEVAFIGIAEKGYLNLKLSVQMSGGHSSIPLDSNAIDVLSQSLARLKTNPFPARISKPVRQMIE
jgi:carboxypeptidase PM20D1